jgi:hypothetical protein
MAISPTNFQALSAFASVAAEYCDLIDSLRAGRPENLYRQLEGLLPRLQAAILPVETEMASRKHPEFKKLELTQDQWSDLAKVVGAAVGKESMSLYVEHGGAKPDANAFEQVDSTRAEMIWDDLTEIYRDLHNGLALWGLKTSDAMAQAAWEWRFGYEAHWGVHLFHAMTTVHEARYRLYVE